MVHPCCMKVLHPCCTSVTSMLHECYVHVARVLHSCCMSATSMWHECFIHVAWVLHPCGKKVLHPCGMSVTSMLHECYIHVAWMLHPWCMSVTWQMLQKCCSKHWAWHDALLWLSLLYPCYMIVPLRICTKGCFQNKNCNN